MKRVIYCVILLTLASCAAVPYRPYAREVKKKPGVEGLISLKPDYIAEDRASADALMAKNCGTKPVRILEEGEVAVGTTTVSTAKSVDQKELGSNFSLAGLKYLAAPKDVNNTETSSSTVAVKEWQISYNCGTETKVAEDMLDGKSKTKSKSKSTKTSKANTATPIIK